MLASTNTLGEEGVKGHGFLPISTPSHQADTFSSSDFACNSDQNQFTVSGSHSPKIKVTFLSHIFGNSEYCFVKKHFIPGIWERSF